MNETYFGNVLKELRLKKQLSQEKLADGICTKRQLIRIEQNENLPTGFLLSALSKKLNENLEPFLLFANHENPMEVIELKQQLDYYFYEKDFVPLMELIDQYRSLHPNPPVDFQQYLGWYEGVAKFHLPQYESPTIEYYIDLLKLTMNFTNLEEACIGFRTLNELNIIHTIITLFYIINNKLVEASQLLPLIIENYLKYYHKYDINLLGRMYYNLANVNYCLDYYDKALEVCETGIKTCLHERSFAVVADLFMCKGSILADQGLMEEATTCAKFFVTLYEMQGKRNQIERVIEQYKALGIDIA